MNLLRAIFVLAALVASGAALAGTAAQSPDELADKFAAAFAAKDINSIVSLYWTKNTDQPSLEMVRHSITADFDHKITGHAVVTLDESMRTMEYPMNGVVYVLDPIATGEIRFDYAANSQGATNMTIPYGQKDGAYYFVTGIPKAK